MPYLYASPCDTQPPSSQASSSGRRAAVAGKRSAGKAMHGRQTQCTAVQRRSLVLPPKLLLLVEPPLERLLGCATAAPHAATHLTPTNQRVCRTGQRVKGHMQGNIRSSYNTRVQTAGWGQGTSPRHEYNAGWRSHSTTAAVAKGRYTRQNSHSIQSSTPRTDGQALAFKLVAQAGAGVAVDLALCTLVLLRTLLCGPRALRQVCSQAPSVTQQQRVSVAWQHSTAHLLLRAAG